MISNTKPPNTGSGQSKRIPNTELDECVQKELNIILNCIQDGIFITDGEGIVLTLNKASEEQCFYTAAELVGRSVRDLIKEGYFLEEEVTTLKAIESKSEVNLILKGTGMKTDILVTAVPYFEGDKVVRVVCTERDITKLTQLEDMLNQNRELALKYERELEYYRAKNLEHTEGIVYRSSKMERTIDLAVKVATSEATILIQGESGVGKGVVAKLIHDCSDKKDKPFISINCAAIPDALLESELFGYEKGAFTGAHDKGKIGIFELANEGTLFLDEISSIPMHMQPKLLRAIQEKEILRLGGSKYIPLNVRIIAASNENLKEAVENKTFREDLYYRINVVPIKIDPLRNRKEDIIPIAEWFLDLFNNKYNTKKKIDAKAWALLSAYHWPGNVRELENIIERLIVTGRSNVINSEEVAIQIGDIRLEEIGFGDVFSNGLKTSLDRYERKLIAECMRFYKNSLDLANALGIDKSTLNRKIQRLGIQNTYSDS